MVPMIRTLRRCSCRPLSLLALSSLSLSVLCAQAPADPGIGIDHVILGVNDLERGMREFAARTGVRPIRGGVHPGRGTQNALVALGDGRYLEIMAPSREAGTEPDPRTAMQKLTPVGWALHTTDLPLALTRVRSAGFTVSEIAPGARTRPDGRQLRWQTASVTGSGVESAPFFIQWGAGSAHPSADAPAGCTLASVAMTEPDPSSLAKFLLATGVAVSVDQGATPRMVITLQCGTRRVVF